MGEVDPKYPKSRFVIQIHIFNNLLVKHIAPVQVLAQKRLHWETMKSLTRELFYKGVGRDSRNQQEVV